MRRIEYPETKSDEELSRENRGSRPVLVEPQKAAITMPAEAGELRLTAQVMSNARFTATNAL